MSLQFRQGDVLIVLQPITSVPRGAQEVPVDPARGVVLAYGEVTGHAHAIELKTLDGQKPNVRYFDYNAERYLQALTDITLRHEEHSPIILKQGVYRQAFQVEDYGSERRAVSD